MAFPLCSTQEMVIDSFDGPLPELMVERNELRLPGSHGFIVEINSYLSIITGNIIRLKVGIKVGVMSKLQLITKGNDF